MIMTAASAAQRAADLILGQKAQESESASGSNKAKGEGRELNPRPSGVTTGYKTLSTHSCSVDMPAASLAATVKLKIPAALETPLTTPANERVMPGGSTPANSEKLTGAVPRIVVNCCV